MSHAMTRAQRLHEMERLYLVRAYTDMEMADRLGVDRTTIYRDRIELEGRIPIYQDDEGRYRIDRSVYISNLRLNLAESLSLYLAARRASQQTRLSHQHVASAIEKLSVTLQQPMTERLVRAADEILSQRQDAMRTVIFSTVATAWAETRRLRLDYLALRNGRTRTHRFEPYLLEPSPWSDGVYLIGHSDLAQRVLTLKMDRIVKAELLGPFTLPADFDEQSLLRHAWGIWGSEDTPETVVLHFAPGQATRRLKESIWHPLEQVTDLADGGCRWAAPIAEWQEMLPWIRGWGADVEVLEPAKLRLILTREAQQLAGLYGIGTVTDANAPPSTVRFYAHTHPDKDEADWQLLRDHLSKTRALATELGEASGISQLAGIAGLLHDIGKYSQAFQNRLRGSNQTVDHATAGAREILALFPDSPHKEFAELISYCIAGHHTGLPNYGSKGDMEADGTLLARREKKKLEDYSAYKSEIAPDALQFQPLSIKSGRFRLGGKEKSYAGFSVSFLTRMLFSTLGCVDV